MALQYGKDAPPIHMVTDGCISRIAGKVSQGNDWCSALVVAFYSAKLSLAQQNYAVHKIEMVAGLETMMHNRELLIGVPFTWYTDHRGLEYLLNQRNLTGHQARWILKMSEFDFKIVYVPGVENTLADLLLCIYSDNAPGTVQTPSEYVQHNDTKPVFCHLKVLYPVKVGLEAQATMPVEVAEGKPVCQQSPQQHVASDKPTLAPKPLKVATQQEPLLVIAPEEGQAVAEKPKPRTRKAVVVKPAEMGHPETSQEFAKHIKKVVFKVPEQPEGGMTPVKPLVQPQAPRRHEEAPPETAGLAAEALPKEAAQLLPTVSSLVPSDITEPSHSETIAMSLLDTIPSDGIAFTDAL